MLRPSLFAVLSTSLLLGVGCSSSGITTHAAEPTMKDVQLSEVILGTWDYDPTHLEEMVRQGVADAGNDVDSIPKDDFDELIKNAIKDLQFTLVFSDDGVVLGSTRIGQDKKKFEWKWSVEGNTVNLYSDDSDEVFHGTYADGKLTIALNVGQAGVQSIRLIKTTG